MITGIPDYQPPIERGLRCVCRRYYVVFMGAAVPSLPEASARALDAARERAAEWNTIIVDSRETPFMICECSQVLEFFEVDSSLP
jgi:hypothetical protein